MGEIVNLGLQNYSHLSQRCELINVTQVPTNSGNAQVQLATFPKVKQKLNEKLGLIDESTWLQEGERFLDVQRAFNWIIYKVGMSDGMVRIEMRNLINSPLVPVRFPSYTDDDSSIIPFQTLEFTDLDGLQWVIILCNGIDGLKCWKFRNESNWTTNSGAYELSESDLGDLEQEEQTEANKLWQVFVQGFFYQYYLSLKDWEVRNFFNFSLNPEDNENLLGWTENLQEFADRVKIAINGIENKFVIVMTEALRDSLLVRKRASISRNRDAGLAPNWTIEMPAGYDYYEGLAGLHGLRQTISNSDQKTNYSNYFSVDEVQEIGTVALAGMGAGAAIGSIVPGLGTLIGAIVGWVFGVAIGALFRVFSDNVTNRWRFGVSASNTNDEENFNYHDSTTAEISDAINSYVELADKQINEGQTTNIMINGVSTPILNCSFTSIPIGNLIGDSESDSIDDPYNKLRLLCGYVSELVNIARNRNVNTRFVAFNGNSGHFIRGQGTFFNTFTLGGWESIITSITNKLSTISVSTTNTYFDPINSLDGFIKAAQKAGESNYSSESTEQWKALARTVANALENVVLPKLNELLSNIDEISEMISKTRNPEFYATESDLMSNLREKVQSKIRLLSGDSEQNLIGAIKYIRSIDLSTIVYFSKEKVDAIKAYLNAIFNYSDIWTTKTHPEKTAKEIAKNNATATIRMNAIINNAKQKLRLDNTENVIVDNLMNDWFTIKTMIEQFRGMILAHRNDFEIYDIETLSHMLVVIAKDKDPNDGIEMEAGRFYYSDAGTTNIQALNFYSAEYANSTPLEFWRLANRLVLFTNNTIEFWDITNDFEDPLSPAYSSNVYSLHVLQNSRVRFNDTLYFIAKPVELDNYSVYSLSKNGQLQQISYPQLDTWINKQIFTDLKRYNPLDTNWNYLVNGSIIDYERVPIIQWHLNDRALNLNYNAMFNTFFLSDEMYFLENLCYFQLNSNIAGTLSNYFNKDKTAIEAIIRTVNTNFDPKKRYKTVAMFHGDVDLEDKRNFIDVSLCRSNNQVVKTVKSYWNKIFEPMGAINVEDYQTIRHKFYRVSNQPSESLRNVLLQPKQGERNVVYRVVGIGMGIDFQTEVRWNGFLRINNLAYEVE